MALWAGTSINTNLSASVFNNLLNPSKVVNFAKKRYATISKLMGEPIANVGDISGNMGFERVKSVNGLKHEIRLIGALPTISFTANGSAELGAVTGNYDADLAGGFDFDLANMPFTQDVPQSEIDKIAGKEAKTVSWIDDLVNQYVLPGYWKKINASINSSDVAPADNAITSFNYIIETDNTYGLDRTDSANADYKGIVNLSTGTLTIDHINSDKNSAAANGGFVTLVVAGTSVYGYAEALIQPFAHVTYSQDTAQFGARNIEFAGMQFLMDSDHPSGEMCYLDPTTWGFVLQGGGIKSSGLFSTAGNRTVNGHAIHFTTRAQLYCNKPNSNVRRTGVTG